MVRKLSLNEVYAKYSIGYFNLLQENFWIQRYRETSISWQEECKGIWLPNFQYLWKLVEAVMPVDINKNQDVGQYLAGKVSLTKKKDTYVATIKSDINPSVETAAYVTMHGSCPEEAMLKLFVYLDSPQLYKNDRKAEMNSKKRRLGF